MPCLEVLLLKNEFSRCRIQISDQSVTMSRVSLYVCALSSGWPHLPHPHQDRVTEEDRIRRESLVNAVENKQMALSVGHIKMTKTAVQFPLGVGEKTGRVEYVSA